MIKTKKTKTVKVLGKSKVSEYIRKEFDVIKSFVKKLDRKLFDKIVKACKDKPSQDVRLQRASCSGVKLLNLYYEGTFKKLRGKEVEVLKFSKGILHTLNASDRKLLTVLGLLTGKDKIDVIKFYTVNGKESHRKALVVKFVK